MPLERRAAGRRNGAREATGVNAEQGTEKAGRHNYGDYPGQRRRQKRWSRSEPGAGTQGGDFARPPPESDVRATDGAGGGGRELWSCAGSGATQPGRGGDRPHADQRTGSTSSSALGEDPSEVAGGDLCAESGEAGRDTEAERRGEGVGDHDRVGGAFLS